VKRNDCGSIASLPLLLVLCVAVSPASAATEPIQFGPEPAGLSQRLPVLGSDLGPALYAVDPERSRNPAPIPKDEDHRVAGERDAVLPDPLNGRELVDRMQAEDMRQAPITERMSAAGTPARAFGHPRTAHHFEFPMPRGT
jgi:hypothetical protein